MQEFEETVAPTYTVDLDISLFGIRNLVLKAEKPRITIRLTHGVADEDQPEPLMMNAEWRARVELTATCNPNFGKIVPFKQVELAKEPLCWPYIEILVDDAVRDEGIFSMGGCEDCFTTISLVSFAKDIVGGHDLLYADAQLHRNQDRLTMVQNQIDSTRYLKQLGAVVEDANNATTADTGGALTE